MGNRGAVWGFFRRSLPVKTGGEIINIDPRSIPNINLYLWRPVICDPPLCSYSQLIDGTYTIDDLADMHEALDLRDYLIRESMKSADNK